MLCFPGSSSACASLSRMKSCSARKASAVTGVRCDGSCRDPRRFVLTKTGAKVSVLHRRPVSVNRPKASPSPSALFEG
jgi:hypothetical protein